MHKWHKEIMAVAEAAKTSSEPWTVLQKCIYNPSEDDEHQDWFDCTCGHDIIGLFVSQNASIDYRIKPRTITINDIEVNEPLRVKPEMGQTYYVANEDSDGGIYWKHWYDDGEDNKYFNNGRIHLKEKDARKHIEADYAGSRIK